MTITYARWVRSDDVRGKMEIYKGSEKVKKVGEIMCLLLEITRCVRPKQWRKQ